MKINKLSLLIGLLAMLFATLLQARELSAPQQVIHDTSNEVKLVLKRDRDLFSSDPTYIYRMVDEVLVPHIDLNRISGLVLGRYWKRATDEQKTSFQHEFKRMLVRTYATAFNELDDNWDTNFLATTPGRNDNDVTVRTKINRNGPPVAVDYRMHFKQGAWKVYDVKIEGMSLVTNYRSSFNRLMRTRGMDGLLAHLIQTNNEKAVAATENANQVQQVAHTTKP